MHKIRTVSRIVKYFLYFTLASILFSLLVVIFSDTGTILWGQQDQLNMWVGVQIDGSWQGFAEILNEAGYNALLLLAPFQLLPYLLINLVFIRLFSLYQQGTIFSQQNIVCFYLTGWILTGNFLVTLLFPALISLILNALFSDSHLSRIISIQDSDILLLLVGMIISVIGWIMAEAEKLKSEQELVI